MTKRKKHTLIHLGLNVLEDKKKVQASFVTDVNADELFEAEVAGETPPVYSYSDSVDLTTKVKAGSKTFTVSELLAGMKALGVIVEKQVAKVEAEKSEEHPNG